MFMDPWTSYFYVDSADEEEWQWIETHKEANATMIGIYYDNHTAYLCENVESIF